MSLEELLQIKVVTASKTEASIEDAPANITVITRHEILANGYGSIAEALRHVLGFYVVDDHIMPNLAVRGVAGGFWGESSTIKLLIDGHPVVFRPTSGNWLGPELVPLSAIDHVEIIRGPASAVYGADAFLGVVNVILRKGSDVKGGDLRAGISVADGDLGHDFDVTVGDRKGPVDFVVGGRLFSEDRSGLELVASSPAPLIPAYHSDQLTADDLDLTSGVLLASGTFRYEDRLSLHVFGEYSSFRHVGDFAPWAQLSNGVDSYGRRNGTIIALRQGRAGLDAEVKVSRALSLVGHAFYFGAGPGKGDQVDVGSDVFYVKRDFSSHGVDCALDGRLTLHETLSTVVGIDLVFDHERLPSALPVLKYDSGVHRAGEVFEAGAQRQGTRDFVNTGAFLQVQWTPIAPYLRMTGGLRHDYHNIYGSQVSGRVAIISRPISVLAAKLLYGSAFKAPSPLLLYGVPYRIGDIIGNHELRPQYVHTVEGQLILTPHDFMQLTGGLSYSYIINKAEFVQRGSNRLAQNLARVGSLALALEAQFRYQDRIRGYVSFELPIARRDFGQEGYYGTLIGVENVIYPQYVLRDGISVRLPKVPVHLGLVGIFAGARRASEMNILERGSSYTLAPYFWLDASASLVGLRIVASGKTDISFKARNILGAVGPDAGYAGIDYPLTSRTFLVQIRQEL